MRNLFFNYVEDLMHYGKENYVLVENKFSKKYKTGFKDYIFYIIGNRGKTSVLELDDYFRIKYNDIKERICMSVSKQNLSKQKTFIDPLFFKDASFLAVKDLYSIYKKDLEKFKDYFVFNIDGSQVNIPNTPQTRAEFDVDLNSLKKKESPKARISVMSDAKNEFIIDSSISNMTVGESVLAFEHIEKAAELIDLTKSIIVFDRYYASAELILQLLEKESHFIFRLKSDTYKKERNKMKTNDEWIDVNLNKNRRQNIKNKELKAKAEELDYLHIRIVNVLLKTGETETLLTNLPAKTASAEELKELYGEKWQIEKGYDILKNKIHLENFSGKRRTIIEKDFYTHILMYNILIEYKTECNKELRQNPKYKDHKCEYKVNVNILAGKLKSSLYEMFLSDTKEERKLIKEEIQKIAKKNTIKVKEKPPNKHNKKTTPKKYPYNNRKNF